MAYNSPRFERVFAQGQATDFRTVNNAAGVWTNTGAKLIRAGVNGVEMDVNSPITEVPWKTGTRSAQAGIFGRKSGRWALNNLPFIASGTAGTAPDMDVLLGSLFGAIGTISAGVSTTYAFVDTTYVPFSLFSFTHGSVTLTSKYTFGCTPQEATFVMNQNVFELSMNGISVGRSQTDTFATDDTAAKGALTTFPVEPSSPTSVGVIQNGFTGIATFDGTAMNSTTCPLVEAQVRLQTGSDLLQNTFGDQYPAVQVGGLRRVSINVAFADNDAAALINLKQKAKLLTSMNISIQVGTVAGSICSFVMKNFQLVPENYRDEDAWVRTTFGQSFAHASAIGNIDDLSIVIT